MTKQITDNASTTVRFSVKEFQIPPVRDCLVVGKEAPTGCVALKNGLSLMHEEPFEDLHLENDIIGAVLIRASILRKVSPEMLLKLMVKRVAPMMSKREVVLVQIDAEGFLECQI